MLPFQAILGPIGWPELLVILGLVLVIFGPRRLPEIAEAFGKSIRKFRTATKDATDDVKKELNDLSHESPEDTPPHKEKE
jgi:sec-independent protein translocase protein TatA